MYDFKRYSFPEERKKNSFIYGFFSLLFILVIVIFTLIADKPQNNNKKIASSNLSSVENKLIVDGIKMEDDMPPVETEGEVIFDDNFDDDIDLSNKIVVDSSKSKKKEKSYNIEELKKRDKRWHHTKYQIQKNDNIWKIAQKFDTNFKLIILANNINNPDILKPGRNIIVPNRKGVFHKVKKGQSLIAIARYYNVPLHAIIAHNSLEDPNCIIQEQTIFIPDAKIDLRDKKDKRNIAKKEPVSVINRIKSQISLMWPVSGKITSGFGTRRNPLGKGRQFHCGLDISCNVGTPVKAALDGTVIYAGWKDGYGNVVVLKHDKGYISVYGHNSKNLVKEGDSVQKGQVIAKSGMTGSVTGAHVHFEFRKYITPLNPLRYLKEK
ncbi:MAG TPA: M23 family metallopeptidase [Spirochaetota bacterium]|nr:M23 family metallopeptidase [Spirochaetota bacterium]HOM09904.1 M23 family metallopeptidase [Spirochaetota bacterium]HPP48751.1 M23 family metallopeptidase [Spirochaetota bacterium]